MAVSHVPSRGGDSLADVRLTPVESRGQSSARMTTTQHPPKDSSIPEKGNRWGSWSLRGSLRRLSLKELLRGPPRGTGTQAISHPTGGVCHKQPLQKQNGGTQPEAAMTTKEEKALAEFRNRVQDLLKSDHDDHYCRKWLKARSFDVDKAVTMFRNSMAYREKMGVDTILETYQPPQVVKDYVTGGFCGFDKDGSPIRVEPYGYLDMKGIMYSVRRVDLEKTKLQQCENTLRDWAAKSKELGRRVDGLTVIFDMDHVSSKALWRPGLQTYLHVVKVMEDNYPEMMKRMFVVNAPRIFPLLWKVCRPLISEDMKQKIQVLGSDYHKVLLQYIDTDQLPAFLGGTKTDPDGDPRCKTLICFGGEVPRSLYLTQSADTANMEEALVAKGDKYKIDLVVEKPGSVLRWEFMTEDYDIGFAVTFSESGSKKAKEVMANRRVDCYMIPEEGDLVCEEPGTYVVVFDNSYSWTRAKRLYYVLELHMTDPTTHDDVDQVAGGSWTRLSKDLFTTKL